MNPLPRVAIFDLDETLAQSFQAPTPLMIEVFNDLISRIPVAIMSGAGFDRIQKDVLARLQNVSNNLSIFPNSASQCYLYINGTWQMEYNYILSDDERAHIKTAIINCMQELTVIKDTVHFGQQIVDREAQIAFTIVGLDAPAEVKKAWDPTGEKRKTVIEYLQKTLIQFDILIGGASTIDITRKDINKAYGVVWLAERLGVPVGDMLYVGDALYPGGNDEVVKKTGIPTRQVSGPNDTFQIITDLNKKIHQ